MKAVLISIQPKWCGLIASGKKTVELRKSKPKIDEPFKCYIYCTSSNGTLHSAYDGLHYHKSYIGKNDSSCINGKVIGEFVCDEIFPIGVFENGSIQDYVCHSMEHSCVPYDDIVNYIGNGCCGYGWHISDLVIYDKPKELREFTGLRKTKFGYEPIKITRPPQSWCYVEELS